MQYAITTARSNRGNYHISDDALTPICGVKTVQRDTAFGSHDTARATWDEFDDLDFRCEACWLRIMKVMRVEASS